MKVAVSITKVFEVENWVTDAGQLEDRMNYPEDDELYLDWYDLEPEQEIWSYAIVKETKGG